MRSSSRRRLPVSPPARPNASPPAQAAVAVALASKTMPRTGRPRKRATATTPAAATSAPAQGPRTMRAPTWIAAASRKRSHCIGSRERSRSDSSNSSTRMTAARKRANAVWATPDSLASEIASTARPSPMVARNERDGRISPVSVEMTHPLRRPRRPRVGFETAGRQAARPLNGAAESAPYTGPRWLTAAGSSPWGASARSGRT